MSQVLDGKLTLLQNMVKRDPVAYKEEFGQQHRHFLSELEIFKLTPSKKADHLGSLVSFLAHTSHCYKVVMAKFPDQVIALVSEHYMVMHRALRKTMIQSLIMMRNKNMIPPIKLLQLSFILFRCQDKSLRALLYSHIIQDVKRLNEKSQNLRVNKQLQNFLYKMLEDQHDMAAKKSLDVMVELYRKRVWTDARTVNVISTACFATDSRLVVTGLRFFLGIDELIDDDEANVEGEKERGEAAMKTLEKKGKKNVSKNTGKKQKKLEKAKNKAKRILNGDKQRTIGPRFPAIQLINDPQSFAEKLFARLKQGKDSFETKCLEMNLISRLIGVHRLILLNFYSFLQKYFQAKQRDVTKILAYFIQALHVMIPPEELEQMVETIANNFITDRYGGEVIAVGINTIREIVQHVPLLLQQEKLEHIFQDAVDYRNYRGDKNVAVAARSMLNLLRELAPQLLKRKERGKDATLAAIAGETPKLRQYGESVVIDHIAGTEMLPGSEEDEEDGDGWEIEETYSDDGDNDGWIDVEHSSDEDVDSDDSGDEGFTTNAAQRRGFEETEIKINSGTLASTAKVDQKDRLEAMRILTPRDFERLAEIRKEQESLGKRKRRSSDHYAAAPVTYAYSHDVDTGTTVQPGDLEGYRVKKRRDLQQRIDEQLASKAGRNQKAPQRTAGMSNKEKEKLTKNFLMITRKRSVQDRQRQSLYHAKKALQGHKMGMKKKTKLMTKLRNRRTKG